MKIVWLASYPKSGNTWLRFFLYNYLFGSITSSHAVGQKIPDIHKTGVIPSDWQGPLLCKTHFAFSENHPNIQNTLGFIYLLRHPKDILLSSLNYCRLEGDDRLTEDEFAHEFIEHMGVKKWRSVGMGNWPEHVQSWLHKPRFPHIILRYEQMLESPRSCFQRVLEFLKIDIDDQALELAIHESSFHKLKQLEEREKENDEFGVVFPGTPQASEQGYRFINQGEAKQSLRHMGLEIEDRFNERFRPILQKLGYD